MASFALCSDGYMNYKHEQMMNYKLQDYCLFKEHSLHKGN